MRNLLEAAYLLSDAGLDATGLTGEAFAVEKLGMGPAMRREKGFDGWLPDGQSVQVKTVGSTKDGKNAGSGAFVGNLHSSLVAASKFQVLLVVQLDLNFRVWRHALISAADVKSFIVSRVSGQIESAFCDRRKWFYLNIGTLSQQALWTEST